MDSDEAVQEELSWFEFCPVCGANLEAQTQKNRSYDLETREYVDRPPTVSYKFCPKGHGGFSVDYFITFNLNKNSE